MVASSSSARDGSSRVLHVCILSACFSPDMHSELHVSLCLFCYRRLMCGCGADIGFGNIETEIKLPFGDSYSYNNLHNNIMANLNILVHC